MPARVLASLLLLHYFTKVARPGDGLATLLWRRFWRGIPVPDPARAVTAPTRDLPPGAVIACRAGGGF